MNRDKVIKLIKHPYTVLLSLLLLLFVGLFGGLKWVDIIEDEEFFKASYNFIDNRLLQVKTYEDYEDIYFEFRVPKTEGNTFLILEKSKNYNLSLFDYEVLYEIRKLQMNQKGSLLFIWLNDNYELLSYHESDIFPSYTQFVFDEYLFSSNDSIIFRVIKEDSIENNIKTTRVRFLR